MSRVEPRSVSSSTPTTSGSFLTQSEDIKWVWEATGDLAEASEAYFHPPTLLSPTLTPLRPKAAPEPSPAVAKSVDSDGDEEDFSAPKTRAKAKAKKDKTVPPGSRLFKVWAMEVDLPLGWKGSWVLKDKYEMEDLCKRIHRIL